MTQKDTECTQAYLTNVIARIIERKEAEKAVPLHAGMQEILAMANTEFRDALNDMVRSGFLTYHKTLNDVSFEFAPPRQPDSKIKKI